MPHAATIAPPPSPRRRTSSGLFGAIGAQAAVAARVEDGHRERAEAEAARVSGNFYVDRMIGSVRLR